MLGEVYTDEINGVISATEKKSSIRISKAKINFIWVCIMMLIAIIQLLKETSL